MLPPRSPDIPIDQACATPARESIRVGLYEPELRSRLVLGETERKACRLFNKADEEFVTELRRQIRHHKIIVSRLELTLEQAEERMARRISLVSPHHCLPAEILGRIFALVDYEPYRRFHAHQLFTHPLLSYTIPTRQGQPLVLPVEWRLRTPFNVSQVCWYWRQVALGTPSLWASPLVDTRKTSSAEMMGQWFRRAKAVPIQLTIWQDDFHPKVDRIAAKSMAEYETERAILKSIASIVSTGTSHVESLRICCEPEPDRFSLWMEKQQMFAVFRALNTVQKTAAKNVKSLIIDSLDTALSTSTGSVLLPSFPFRLFYNIRVVQIRGYIPSKTFFSTIPYDLTTLKLDAPASSGMEEVPNARNHYADLVMVLISLRRLECLRLKGKFPRQTSYNLNISLPSSATVQLPHLTRLTLVGYPCATYLCHLSTPKLKSLKLKHERYVVPPDLEDRATLVRWQGIGPIARSFLKRCGGSLRRLSLIKLGCGVGREDLASWLKSANALERLTLVQRGSFLNYAAKILSSQTAADGSWEFCPSLETLEWSSTGPTKAPVDWSPLEVRWSLSTTQGGAKPLTIRLYKWKGVEEDGSSEYGSEEDDDQNPLSGSTFS